MSANREKICLSASKKLSTAAASLASIPALVGFDGFVDEILAVVDKRLDTERFVAVTTIDAFGQKILRAAGQSSNYELHVKQTKLGGNGPIMANALAAMGFSVTYIGNLGYPHIHPVFADFAKRAHVISIADPGHTDALEFEDGKLMLGKLQPVYEVTWENLAARVGRPRLTELAKKSRLIGMVDWAHFPSMTDIWSHFGEEILTAQFPRQDRTLFIDMADPEKRTEADILAALQTISKIQGKIDVNLGLNLKESSQIAAVLGIPVPGDGEAVMQQTAAAIREKLGVACVVIHPRRGAAAATEKESASFEGPFVHQPKISTGAGDHFNAGFCLGRILGCTLEESLCTGVATSGYYVRNAASPTGKELAEFIAELPPPMG